MENRKNRSRSKLILEITKLVISKYPVSWKASELALVTGESQRSVHRALSEMIDSDVIEKHYTAYRLSTVLANQIYGAKWYVKQELDKDFLVMNKGGKESCQRI